VNVRIIPVALGFDQCYLLQAGGAVLVDAGVPGKAKTFARTLETSGIAPRDVKLIVLTHGHWDHVGSARDIRNLTGARLALHEREAPWLENAFAPMPPGATAWGRILGGILSLCMPFVRIPACRVDLKLGNDREVLVKPKLMDWQKLDIRFDQHGNVAGWMIKETWSFEVQNSKEIDVMLDIRRNFPGDWELKTEAPHEKVDAGKVKFVLPLKSHAKQTFTYELTTRYGTNVTR
jgi:hypothetical protein